MASLLSYRWKAWLRHHLSAWNTHGEGVHSPYLYALIHYLLDDQTTQYYSWKQIRQATGHIGHREQRRNEAFFRIAHQLGQEHNHDLVVLCAGSTQPTTISYLALTDSRHQIYVLDDKQYAQHKKEWQTLHLKNIHPLQTGSADYSHLLARANIILLQPDNDSPSVYPSIPLEHLNGHDIVLVCDIHHSLEHENAWQQLCHQDVITSSMDCYDFGLLFVDRHYLPKHYTLIV